MDCDKNEHCSWLRAQDVLLDQEQKKYESILSSILDVLNSEDNNIQSLIRQEITEINTDLLKENPLSDQGNHSENLNRFEALWKSARMEQNSFLPGFLQKEQ